MRRRDHCLNCYSARRNVPEGSHRGSALVELVIAIGIATLILSTGLGALHLFMHAERSVIRNTFGNATFARLSRAFRNDVHAAKRSEPANADGIYCTLEMPDKSRVAYRAAKNAVLRTRTAADGTREDEQFRLPQGSKVQVEQLAEPARVRLVVSSPRFDNSRGDAKQNQSAQSAGAGERVLVVEPVTARDHRFEEPAR